MDLEAIAPIIELIIKETLEEKRYPYGFAKFQGTSNKVASGRLRDSVKVTGSNEGTNYILQIIMLDYFQWVQSGRLPGKKFVPVGALIQWIKDRKLSIRNKKTGKFAKKTPDAIKSMAYAIQRNINKFGIKPANFLDISIEKIMEDPRIQDLLEGATYDDLINAIEGI